MSRIHRKTPKGLHEIETRGHGLPARMRSALILVDGRRSDAEIIGLLGRGSADLLVELAWQNYIVRVDQSSPDSTRPLPELRRWGADPSGPSSGDAARWHLQDRALTRVRKNASRQLTDRLGPFAQTLARRLEEADSVQALEPLLEQSANLIHNMLGAEAEAAYRDAVHRS
jgi:hypothetical protein